MGPPLPPLASRAFLQSTPRICQSRSLILSRFGQESVSRTGPLEWSPEPISFLSFQTDVQRTITSTSCSGTAMGKEYTDEEHLPDEESDGLLHVVSNVRPRQHDSGLFHTSLLYSLIILQLGAIICLGSLLDRQTCRNPALELWCKLILKNSASKDLFPPTLPSSTNT